MATKLLKPVRRELLASSTIGKYRGRKKKEYEIKKKAGFRNLRKPKRIAFPIDRAIIDALK